MNRNYVLLSALALLSACISSEDVPPSAPSGPTVQAAQHEFASQVFPDMATDAKGKCLQCHTSISGQDAAADTRLVFNPADTDNNNFAVLSAYIESTDDLVLDKALGIEHDSDTKYVAADAEYVALQALTDDIIQIAKNAGSFAPLAPNTYRYWRVAFVGGSPIRVSEIEWLDVSGQLQPILKATGGVTPAGYEYFTDLGITTTLFYDGDVGFSSDLSAIGLPFNVMIGYPNAISLKGLNITVDAGQDLTAIKVFASTDSVNFVLIKSLDNLPSTLGANGITHEISF